MDRFETILNECLAAYSDCHEETPKAERSTNFKASMSLTGEQFVTIINRCNPNGYNEFDAIAAQNVAAMFGNDAEYMIAREGSVCVYVKPRKGVTWLNRTVSIDDLKADEVSIQPDGTIRIWWD